MLGHARGAAGSPTSWTPAGGVLPGKPLKGALRVLAVRAGAAVDADAAVEGGAGDGPAVVAETGPEPRPFPLMKALDADAIGDAAVEAARALQ